MDEITVVKSELRLKHWTELIAECQASDQTVKAWCKQHDFSDKTYYYWLRKVCKQTMEQAGISLAKENPSKQTVEAVLLALKTVC